MNRNYLERIPLNGTFELTARCNLKCKMCLVRIDGTRMAELGGRERTTEEWIQMAQEVQNAGTLSLLLTGGEPMLRPDFAKIYKAIVQMGFMLTLYTNATLITEDIIELLEQYPPHRIGITIYGASPETYEKVTGNANAYYNMLKGVQLLSKLPSKLSIRTTIIKDNLDDIQKIKKIAYEIGNEVEFSVSRIVTKPVRGGVAEVDSCRLTPEQNVDMIKKRKLESIIEPFAKFLLENPKFQNRKETDFEIGKEEQLGVMDKFLDETKVSDLYGCDAGINSYAITWDGKLFGCQMLSDCWTYPFDDGFQNAWIEYPQKVDRPILPKQCIKCNVSCCACPATRLAETGSLNGLPQYVCRESKLAYEMNKELKNTVKEIIKMKG